MDINPTTLVLVSTGSTLLGVIVTSFFNLRATRMAKESEERTQNKELVVRAAIENWKQGADLIMKSGRGGKLQPLDVYLVHMAATANVIFDPTTTPENIEARFQTVDTLTEIANARATRLAVELRKRHEREERH